MLHNLSKIWTKWCREGVHLPYAYDAETNKPSITLMFFWLVSFISIISLVALHFKKDLLTGTLTSALFLVVGFVMYRLRKLDKVKIDIKNQSVDLENNEKDEK